MIEGIAPCAAQVGASELDGVPPLYREQAERFVQFYDAGLIPCPEVPA